MEQLPLPSSESKCVTRDDIHVLVVPYALQGHIRPFLKLSESFVQHGIKTTLLVTEHTYRHVNQKINHAVEGSSQVNVVAISDGLGSLDDRKDERKVAASFFSAVPGQVKNLIADANKLGGTKRITCLVADAMFGWALETAEQMGIKAALFWTASPGALAVTLRIPELIEAGVIDNEGTPLRTDNIQLLPNMPPIDTSEFPWCNSFNGDGSQKIMFRFFSASQQVAKVSRWLLCNYFHELDTSARAVIPNLVPVGPLSCICEPTEIMEPKDSTVLKWLDQQQTRSVVYIAFGTLSTMSQKQLNELALGLEPMEQGFLLVVRSDTTGGSSIQYPDGFLERVAGRGKIVEWAPQEKVLAHPSIACFLSHCGWNSTMEGMSSGVPFLCWPCFGDQIYTRTCICDGWKIGLNFVQDEENIISRHEIKRKIDELLSLTDIYEKSRKLKTAAKKAVVSGGSSFDAVEGFIEQIKG
ncbi:hypothetical protein Droror1_Dr00004603 [Drosera rotundifolia]